MTQRGSAYHLEAAKLNSVATCGQSNCRIIDCLKQLVYDCNLTSQQARTFGDLK